MESEERTFTSPQRLGSIIKCFYCVSQKLESTVSFDQSVCLSNCTCYSVGGFRMVGSYYRVSRSSEETCRN